MSNTQICSHLTLYWDSTNIYIRTPPQLSAAFVGGHTNQSFLRHI